MKFSILILASLCSSAFALSDIIKIESPALFPESIVIDTQSNTLIAGSLALGILVSISFEGVVETFINDTDISDSNRGVVGIQVDSVSRVVWACIQDLDYEKDKYVYAGIAAWDLDTKERRFLSQLNGVDPSGDPHGVFCNDVVHTSDGTNAYVTDSFGDRIFKVSSSGVITLDSADTLLRKNIEDLIGINGIEINADESELIICQQSNGKLLRYDLSTNTVTKVTGLPLFGCDGISYTNGARTELAVTDLFSGYVYKIKIDERTSLGEVIGREQVADADEISCTVVIEGKVYALSSYLSEFYAGEMTRRDFQLTRVTFPASVEPWRILAVIIVISLLLLVYLKE